MTQTRLVGGAGPAGRDVVPLGVLLDGWVRSGLITRDQAAAMRSSVRTGVGPRTRPLPVVAEALAYVGGAVVLAGAALLAAYYWDELAVLGRVLLLLTAAGALLGAGAAVPTRFGPSGRRLTGVLWLGATASWAGAVSVLAADGDRFGSEAEAVLVTAATVVAAAALHALHRYALQQAALILSTAALAGASVAWWDLGAQPGVGVWIVGVTWAWAGLAGLVRSPETPLALGSAVAVLGAMTTGDTDPGMAFTLVTVAAVLALAVLRRDLLLLGVGAVAVVINVPAAMSRWFAGSVAAAAALVVAGAVLVALAVWIARRDPGGR